MHGSFLAMGALAFVAQQAVAQLPPSVVISRDPIAPTASFSAGAGLQPTTLADAWRRAEEASTAIQSARASLKAVEGQLTDARALLWNNPEIRGETVSRDVPQPGASGQTYREWAVGVQQAFEIGGQQGYRREAATRELAALESTIEETRRQVRAEVERRFVRVLALQERIATEDEALRLVNSAATTVNKRVIAGEDSRLDGNLAAVEAVRVGNQIASLREQLIDARTDMAVALQLPANTLPEGVGDLSVPSGAYTLEELLASAMERPQLRALDLRENAARSRLDLERASVYPDITLGVGSGREGPSSARENLVVLTVSVPLRRNSGNGTGIGKATTDLTQAQIDRQAAARDVPALVRALWQKVESLRARLKRLEDSAVSRLDENQRLSTKAYAAGEIGLLQLIVVNRQMVDGRRDLLDARTELRLATIALEAAAGWQSTGRPQ